MTSLPNLCMGLMVAGFQQKGKVWEDQDQLKKDRRCCWAEGGGGVCWERPEAVESLKIVVVSFLVVRGSRTCCGVISQSISPSIGCSWNYTQYHGRAKEFAEILASNSVEKVENSTGIWAGGQVIAGGLLGLGLGPLKGSGSTTTTTTTKNKRYCSWLQNCHWLVDHSYDRACYKDSVLSIIAKLRF